jgi:hypothetical protein
MIAGDTLAFRFPAIPYQYPNHSTLVTFLMHGSRQGMAGMMTLIRMQRRGCELRLGIELLCPSLTRLAKR